MKQNMTIRKRIFWTNSCMVFLALLVLLLIGGGMLSLFKGELLGWYRDNSKISDNYELVYDSVPGLLCETTNWESVAQQLDKYDYRLLVRNDAGETIYQNVKHSEEESAETLFDVARKAGATDSYVIEHTTIIAYRSEVGGQQYDCYVVNCPSDASIFGIDRGMFEMFILIFLAVGVVAILVILLLSQLLTKRLLKKILDPIQQLDSAAQRVTEGKLDTPIHYEGADEFRPVCDSFDFMQQHLKDELDKNKAYEKARTEMVSGISHDLRTPLTSIKGYVKGMIDGVADTKEKQQQYLQITYCKSCDMERLLSKLFYFSKLETGNMPFYKKQTDMQLFLSDYAEEKSVELVERGILLEAKWNVAGHAFCDLDCEQMLRVFDNLVENSCKYAQKEEGLQIDIEAVMTTHDSEDWLSIAFSDNGAGLEEEKLAHVFEQFYRGDEARNAACDGNGLGLYVCKYIVEKHGGTIRAKNLDGFCVIMELPIVKETEYGNNFAGGR